MTKVILFLTSLFISLHYSSSWTTIECNYKDNGDYHVIRNIYVCYVSNNPLISTDDSAQINSVNGEHIASKSYDGVTGFHARQKAINSFPRGLQKYFKNLKVIHIHSCGLKEIRQSDLKFFPQLVYFFLESNYIEVIEESLFDSNQHLEGIGLWESSIVHIDPKVFDNLSKLSCLWLSLTSCVKNDVKDSKDKVKELIKLIKNQCTSDDFRVQRDQLKIIENEAKTSNFGEVKEKIQNFEKSFNNSKFLRFHPLKDKLVSLKNLKSDIQDKDLVDLTSKVDLETEKCSNIDSVHKNLSTTMKHEFDSIKMSLDELKTTKIDDFEDKFAHFGEKLAKIDRKMSKFDEKLDKFEQKFGNFEKYFAYFEVKNAEKFDKIDKEFGKIRHKIGTISDGIKGIEERLIEKFEEILEEKLGKVFQF